MLIDTHCHLNFKAFTEDRDEVVKRAKRAGISFMIIPGADPQTSKKAIEVAEKFKDCFAAVGIHPHHTNKILDFDQAVVDLQNLAQRSKKVIAIGETGLDYYQYKGEPAISRKDNQQELFKKQVELSLKLNLPLILHCRQAFDDFFDLLSSYFDQPTRIKGVLHCFSGGLAHLRQAIKWRLFLGFDGNISYDKRIQGLVLETPLDRLLLETDSPLLTPEPFRGQRNEPKNVKIVGRWVAKIKGITFPEVMEVTTRNSKSLFNLC